MLLSFLLSFFPDFFLCFHSFPSLISFINSLIPPFRHDSRGRSLWPWLLLWRSLPSSWPGYLSYGILLRARHTLPWTVSKRDVLQHNRVNAALWMPTMYTWEILPWLRTCNTRWGLSGRYGHIHFCSHLHVNMPWWTSTGPTSAWWY